MFKPFTLNDKLRVDIGGRVLTVKQIPVSQQFIYLQSISFHFTELMKIIKDNKSAGLSPHYLMAVRLIWEIYKGDTRWYNRWILKRRFYKKALTDIGFFFDCINEVYNFWLCLGKWLTLLGEGLSIQMKFGSVSTEQYICREVLNKK